MSIFVQEQTDVLLRTKTLEVKLARSFAEINAALRLRFEVFNLELQEGLVASYERGYDTDAYDAYCDHLIVAELATKRIVGTYRLLRQTVAQRNIGFYSENEFDLTRLKKLPGELLELGRSCVARSHRTAGVIALLWPAIIAYAAQHNVRYLFGCGSLHQTEPHAIQPIFSYLHRHHFAPPEYRVFPRRDCGLAIDQDTQEMDTQPGRPHLPPLLKGYLRAGAMICGAPSYDVEFGTADVLVLLEMERLTARYRNHYAQSPSSVQGEY